MLFLYLKEIMQNQVVLPVSNVLAITIVDQVRTNADRRMESSTVTAREHCKAFIN